MVDLDAIRRGASELVRRHGPRALDIAEERADILARAGKHRDLDTALLVLNEVERLLRVLPYRRAA